MARCWRMRWQAGSNTRTTGLSRYAAPVQRADRGQRHAGRAIAERARVEGLDIAIGLPELPIRVQGQPLVAGASGAERAAVVSLPALGGWRMRSRARSALVDLVRSLHAGQDEVQNGAAELARK